jgi:hypothetical protein
VRNEKKDVIEQNMSVLVWCWCEERRDPVALHGLYFARDAPGDVVCKIEISGR